MDNEELTDKLKENEKIIEDLNNQLNEHKFIQSQNKEYIFTLEAELNKKNKKIKKLNEKNKKYKFKPVNNENKSKKSKILDKFLNMSNRYVFYKNNYELLRNAHEYDNKIIKSRDSQIKTYRKENNFLKNDIKNKQKDIKYLQKIFNDKSRECDTLNKELNNSNILINLLKSRLEYNAEKLTNKIDFDKLNIAYILNSFPMHSETFIVNEIRWLKNQGYNVIVFKRHDPSKPINLDFYVKTIRFNEEFELERLLLENNIDIMHTHFVYPICTNYTFPIAERLKIPFSVFAHAYDIFTNTSDENNNVKEISESKFCKAIFTLSDFHKNYLLKRGVLEEKIVITKQATGYELAQISEKKNKMKKIISISRFVEKKGLDVLIDAAKLLEGYDFEFSIYGFGVLEEKLQNKIQDLGCSNISIKGELHPDEVKNKLKEADLLVAPCKVAKNGDMDGFPTVIFEAMAVGLPVLTTSVSAIPEIIEDGVNGFIIDPENPEMLSEKIKELSQIPNEKLFEIRKQAQNDVKNISSVDKTMEVYIKTIKNSFE